MTGYRFFILGAGFSKPAGLPLGIELWQEIRERAVGDSVSASHLEDDLDVYIQYRHDCDGVQLSREDVDFEEFLAFLDLEHFLGLRGSDGWSEEGNQTQVIVKTLIGKILCDRTPPKGSLPDVYYEFASSLGKGDYILTFNYDTVLERALEHVGKAYRLFSQRYTEIHGFSGTVDMSRDEVAILKLHGSIDWFDRKSYSETEESYRYWKLDDLPRNPVFGPDSTVTIQPLLEDPQFTDDPLRNMWRVNEIERLYSQSIRFRATPWVLAPSTAKVVYADKLRNFWWGLGRSGGWNLGLSIVGYSLPPQDDYARHMIYRIVNNYQGFEWDAEFAGERKRPVYLIDYKTDATGREEYEKRYSFVDRAKTYYHFDGFNREAVRLINQ